MKNNILICGLLVLALISCTSNANKDIQKLKELDSLSKEANKKVQESKIEWHFSYKYIKSKQENTTQGINKMDLYYFSGDMLIDTVKTICIKKQREWVSGASYYIVFFDDKKNAVFPNNPFSAFYGIDEKPLKHIRAYYEFNRLNGYSKLTMYGENAYESPAVTYDL
jgi:hypothetical protein